jgi:hypothetical protein
MVRKMGGMYRGEGAGSVCPEQQLFREQRLVSPAWSRAECVEQGIAGLIAGHGI